MIYKIEKEEGKEIHGIKVGEIQISKNELTSKELILKGNEHFYKNEYDEAIDSYDKALKIKPDFAELLYNKRLAQQELGKGNDNKGFFSRF
jgi:tetratricopeptide (TPR) repeat protein